MNAVIDIIFDALLIYAERDSVIESATNQIRNFVQKAGIHSKRMSEEMSTMEILMAQSCARFKGIVLENFATITTAVAAVDTLYHSSVEAYNGTYSQVSNMS